MFLLDRDSDTICAISTAPGNGAIAIVRISGNNSRNIVRKCLTAMPENMLSHTVHYGIFHDPETLDSIDEVLVTYFAKGRSFTAEETIEISCHGSQAITQDILHCLVKVGARLAQRGEFTYRAFSNGRIDLIQAESVLSLIESQSGLAARMALRQLQGDLSSKILLIEKHILWCLSRLEANIDFSTEDIEFEPHEKIVKRAREALDLVDLLLATYKRGRAINHGFRVAIVGAPNVGKSSLLNSLANTDKAIISSIAGTTRDPVEADIEINGQIVKLVDTAGLRDTPDEIETLGIKKTHQILQEVDLICYVYDVQSTQLNKPNFNLHPEGTPVIFVANKADLIEPNLEVAGIRTSSLNGTGILELKKKIAEFLLHQNEETQTVVFKVRQFELLQQISEQLNRAYTLLENQVSPEFVVSDMQAAMELCFELSGKKFDDNVLDKVFQDFCLGK